MAEEAPLRQYVGQLIRRRGRIPFSEYMEAVLYHPDYGYYSRASNPIGPDGDYYTASSVDPAFGQLLAGLFRRMAADIEGFQLVELGAGTGLLARHILEVESFPYRIVERSPGMRLLQGETLQGLPVEWGTDLPASINGCVFSNEFFDALPVRRFVRRSSRLREIFVTEGPDGLSEIEDEPEVDITLPLLEEGCLADVSLEAGAWVRRIGGAIRSGYHLAIDYGYESREFFSHGNGTLMCYRRHQADQDPYVDIGSKDLTAHVNFSDLIEGGAEVGLESSRLRTQMEFLVELGVLDLMAPLASRQDAASIRRLSALKNLLLPPMMGERFKVLLQRKGLASGRLDGFEGTMATGSGG
jgi:SAM-dependent MidA family methyltransferase